MKEIGFLWLVLIACAAIGFSDCSSNRSQGEAHTTRIKPANVDGLEANKQVYLNVAMDTVKNCDSNSQYKELIKVRDAQGGEKNSQGYDSFSLNGKPIVCETFLKAVNDSLYIMATVESPNKEESYTSLCIEKKFISGVFVNSDPEAKKETKRGRGEHGMGRRRGGGVPGYR